MRVPKTKPKLKKKYKSLGKKCTSNLKGSLMAKRSRKNCLKKNDGLRHFFVCSTCNETVYLCKFFFLSLFHNVQFIHFRTREKSLAMNLPLKFYIQQIIMSHFIWITKCAVHGNECIFWVRTRLLNGKKTVTHEKKLTLHCGIVSVGWAARMKKTTVQLPVNVKKCVCENNVLLGYMHMKDVGHIYDASTRRGDVKKKQLPTRKYIHRTVKSNTKKGIYITERSDSPITTTARERQNQNRMPAHILTCSLSISWFFYSNCCCCCCCGTCEFSHRIRYVAGECV